MGILKRLLMGMLLATMPAAAAAEEIAIVGADVLPMTGRERLTDQTVLVSGDRITAIGPRGRVRVPSGARVIDASGLTLMPGLVDMHIHLSPEPGRPGDSTQRALALSLAHGVTTARIMSGQPVHPEVRAAVERGEIAGPRLYAAAPPLHQGNVQNPEQARQAVAAAKAAGFDLVKSHQLPDLAIWQAVQDEARRLGIPTAGHVANSIGLERAMAAGQQVEHLDGAFAALLPPGSPTNFGQFLPPPVLETVAAASDAEYAALARRVAEARSHHVPTLSLFERLSDMETPLEGMMASPDSRFVADWILNLWRQQRQQLADSGWTAANGNQFRDVRRRLVRAFHQAGVPLMPGSDTPHPFQVWGVALIREVEALGAAGLEPMAALRSATIVPRDYFRSLPNGGSALGWRADFGTVEPGARADLILLERDPSRDLGALRSLRTVIAAGRVYDRAALDSMLEQAARDGKAQPAPPGQAPAAAAAAPAAAGPIYVMRHLNTPAGERDPDLTADGRRLAALLADRFGEAPPRAIYVSDYRRTRQTAAPLAERLGLTPIVYDPADTPALIARVRAGPSPALVVGHSNTVPDIIEQLGGTRPAPLQHEDFGDVWRVEPGGTTRSRIEG